MSDLFSSPTAMVRIDGSKVRQLRETKGLTQLYIATSVGVTTETISRWENRRYPTIKQENAAKLADALEVDLTEILENEAEELEPETPDELPRNFPYPSPPQPAESDRSGKMLAWLVILTVAISILLVQLWTRQSEPPSRATATRLLPMHSPAGSPFPVIITVTSDHTSPYSVLLKESLPPGCTITASSPPHIPLTKAKRTAKWISRSQGGDITFALLVTCTDEKERKEVRFSGSVTLKNEGNTTTIIGGPATIVFANYHWADTNRDKMIADEEILEAYDRYGALDNVQYDWFQLDELWSGSGYLWDPDSKKFKAIP